jgi:FMN reductase
MANLNTPPLKPFIVGLGGSLRPNSATEKAVRLTLQAAQQTGAETLFIGGPELELPMYDYGKAGGLPAAQHLIAQLRRADGVILASPGYHGSMSGLMKNAVDYIEEMSKDPSPYLHGRAVGCIATAGGWQGGATTLAAMRDVVHALRGWPTPLGVVINTAEPAFDEEDNCTNPRTHDQLICLGQQVAELAWSRNRARADAAILKFPDPTQQLLAVWLTYPFDEEREPQ